MSLSTGYNTYLLVVALIAVGVLHFHFHFINDDLAKLLYSILGPALAITIRAGMKKDTTKALEQLEMKMNGEKRNKK
jgi:hypothetical protein